MAVIYEDALLREIKSGRPSRVYALFGDDLFLKRYYFNKLCDISYGGEAFFNLQHFEGEIDLQNVYDAVKQFPMMAESKCVTVSDFDFEHVDKSQFERLCSLITEVENGCVLILKFDSVDFDYRRSSKAKKIVSAIESNGGKAVCLDHRRPEALTKMLVDGAKKRNCKMTDSVSRFMIELVGDDISTLQNELDKVCFYQKEGEITKQTVESIVVKSVEASVYDYVKEVLNADLEKALLLLNNMFYLQIEPMVMLYTIVGSYVDIARVLFGSKAGVKTSQIALDFLYKNKSFLLDKAVYNLRKIDKNKLNLSLDALIWADRALKSTGSNSEVVMEQLTVKLIYIIVKGESVDKA